MVVSTQKSVLKNMHRVPSYYKKTVQNWHWLKKEKKKLRPKIKKIKKRRKKRVFVPKMDRLLKTKR